MGNDILSKLLEVEKEARGILAQAERDADAAMEKAREEARDVRLKGREQARTKADELVDEASAELDEKRRKRLEEERAKLPTAGGLEPERLAEAAEVIVKAVAYGEAPPE